MVEKKSLYSQKVVICSSFYNRQNKNEWMNELRMEKWTFFFIPLQWIFHLIISIMQSSSVIYGKKRKIIWFRIHSWHRHHKIAERQKLIHFLLFALFLQLPQHESVESWHIKVEIFIEFGFTVRFPVVLFCFLNCF